MGRVLLDQHDRKRAGQFTKCLSQFGFILNHQVPATGDPRHLFDIGLEVGEQGDRMDGNARIASVSGSFSRMASAGPLPVGQQDDDFRRKRPNLWFTERCDCQVEAG